MTEPLFDPATLRKLEQLTLSAAQVRAGAIKGERRSKKRGTSIEFADYRDYVKGDDLRRLDWNIYARHNKAVIKLREDEEDLASYFLLDASASMDWNPNGQFGQRKYVWGIRALAGLAYISLMSGDRVTVNVMHGDGNLTWGPHRGRAYLLPMLKQLEQVKAGGRLDLTARVKDFVTRNKRPGVCMLVSDMMYENGYQDILRTLQGRGFEVTLIHILTPDEVEPTLDGDLRLIDVETGREQEVTVDDEMRAIYKQRLLAWREEIGAFCLKRGIHYIGMDTGTSWEQLILFELRRIGVLK